MLALFLFLLNLTLVIGNLYMYTSVTHSVGSLVAAFISAFAAGTCFSWLAKELKR